MAIERNSFKVACFHPVNHSLHSSNTHMFSDDEDFQRRNSISDVEQDDDDLDDYDSGGGSDDFDLLELGETGEEFCQVGDQICSIPSEIYDLPGLKDVLSMEAWNELLTEGERFKLARFLPDMDQEDFMITLKELFSGDNLHFGSPLDKMFEMLKGGLCEPRVALYRQGLNFFQRRKHYHNLKKYQNTLVYNIYQMRNAWQSCWGYSTEEKLHLLNIMKSQKILMNENKEELGGEKATIYGVAVHRDQDFPQVVANRKCGVSKIWKRHPGARANEDIDSFRGVSISERNDLNYLGGNKAIDQLSDIKVLTAMPSNMGSIYDGGKRVKHADNIQKFIAENQMKARISSLLFKGGQVELLDGSESTWLSKQHGGLFPSGLSSKHSDLNAINKRWKLQVEAVELQENYDLLQTECRAKKSLKDKFQANSQQNGRQDWMAKANQGMQTFSESEETESSSSEQMDEDDRPLMSKRAYPGNMSDLKYGRHTKKAKLSVSDKNDSHLTIIGSSDFSRKTEGYSKDLKGKMNNIGYLKDEVCRGYSAPHLNYMHDYKFDNDWFWMQQVKVDNRIPFKLHKKGQMFELPTAHHLEMSNMPLMECYNLPRKWNMKHDNNDHLHADAQLQLDDMSSVRKHGKTKMVDVPEYLEKGMAEQPVMEMQLENVEAGSKPQKKPFPLITPTVISGFSFSIIHLLSAVRMAMILTNAVQDRKQEDANAVNASSNMDANSSKPSAEALVPSLTVQEIVNRVRSNPGDPSILKTQEPLQDLIRSVLKMFSSRFAPLGAKGWKPLVVYERSSKCWSWVGPVSDFEAVEEVTSPESWGIPHNMLGKLVDSYANWLKNSQDALRQIAILPSPPSTLMQLYLNEKERFKDLRVQKSPCTITPSPEEVKAYFHKEEFLRYLIPDRAFLYTAVDGKKSIVAPLRCGGKLTSKARDHFMLKRNRPPHVTILCLVRDAAARLPGSIGTRSDICTLIRDSQYVVEDVSDVQVNQVVSGALDRLHYGHDPCVQFDGERKLWMYLHREREEEDFDDTSSTKRCSRQKKQATEPSDNEDVTFSYRIPVRGHSEFDLVSDQDVLDGL
ncbi:hypothetical protein ACS0TY_014975 [Phlomoides rotata]